MKQPAPDKYSRPSRFQGFATFPTVPQDSPVEQRRKQLPRGNGDWPGYSKVYATIAQACQRMATTTYIYLSDEHVNAMAVLGSGDEMTMKYEQMRLRDRGFI